MGANDLGSKIGTPAAGGTLGYGTFWNSSWVGIMQGPVYLHVEPKLQAQAPTLGLISVLSAQQVLIEVGQGQAGPELRVQHAGWG